MKKIVKLLGVILSLCFMFTAISCGEDDNPLAQTSADHTHSYAISVISPTCVQEGYTLHKCSCGASYKTDQTSVTLHKGRGVCSVCKKNLFILGRNYIIQNGTRSSSGSYACHITEYYSETRYMFMYSYDPGDPQILLSLSMDNFLCFIAIDTSVSGRYMWALSHSTYDYMLGGYLNASTFTDDTTYLSYSVTEVPSSLILSYSQLGASAVKVILSKFNLVCESMGISVANLGFTAY